MSEMRARGFVFANVRDFPRMADVLALADFDESNDYGSVVATAESQNRTDELAQAMPNKSWRHVAHAGFSPAISYGRWVYQTLAVGFYFLHDKVPNVCDQRQIAWARVQERESGIVMEFQSVHYVPSKDNHRRFAKGSRTNRLINKTWVEGRTNQRHTLYRNMYDDVPTIVFGDFNDEGRSLGTTIGGQRMSYVTASNKIDKMVFIPSRTVEWDIYPKSKHEFDLHSDHNGLAIRARARRRK